MIKISPCAFLFSEAQTSVGPHVVRQLAAHGHEVTIFHRGKTEADLPRNVRHIHGDFAEFPDHLDKLRRTSPEVIGLKGDVVALPGEQLPASLRRDVFDFSQQYAVDSNRIRKELGYTETLTFDEALQRTVEWERANPLAKIDPETFTYADEDAALAAIAR